MSRNFDISLVRAFLTVAETGGITRAAGILNLTQSTVSLQIKRLEDAMGMRLFDRGTKGLTLTSAGLRFVDDARALLDANDLAWSRLGDAPSTVELNLGAPEDLLYPHVPAAMRACSDSDPTVGVRLWTGLTVDLKSQFRSGEIDVLLATEREPDGDAIVLSYRRLVWMGARGGRAWKRRPFPLGTVEGCAFTRPAVEALNASGLDWYLGLAAANTFAIEASMMADAVVHMQLEGTIGGQFEPVSHDGTLPELPEFAIALYVTDGRHRKKWAVDLAERLRSAFVDGLRAVDAA